MKQKELNIIAPKEKSSRAICPYVASYGKINTTAEEFADEAVSGARLETDWPQF